MSRSSDHPDRQLLVDQIADLVDRYGRDLDSTSCAAMVEGTAARLQRREADTPSRSRLHDELRAFADRWEGDPNLLGDCLELVARDLGEGRLQPEVTLSEPDATLEVTFSSAVALERQIDRFFDVTGYFLETDCKPADVDHVEVVVRGASVDDAIRLEGRIVRSAPNGVAIQLFTPPAEVRRRLDDLPGRMLAALRAYVENLDD